MPIACHMDRFILVDIVIITLFCIDMFCLYGLCNPFILFKSIINMYVDFQGQRFPS